MTHRLPWLRALLLILALAVSGLPAGAQDVAQPDYNAWDLRARADETKLDLGTASISELETMRARLADWRAQFLEAQGINRARIETLKAQIDALGAPPAEGEEEDPAIAERRAALNAQLTELNAPVIKAEEAYTRADGIIGEIDRIIRERQTKQLLALGPSPLNPANWPAAAMAVQHSLQASLAELSAHLSSSDYQAETRRKLPVVILLLFVGVMLISRGKRWAVSGVERLRGDHRRGTGVFRFLLSLGQILLPYLGIYALIEAVDATGVSGTRWTFLLQQLQIWAAVLLFTRWVADQTFHHDDSLAAVSLTKGARRRARRLANLLAWLFVARGMVDALVTMDSYGDATTAVLQFPVLVISAWALLRLCRVLSADAYTPPTEDEEDRTLFRRRLLRLLGHAGSVVAIVGPLMAAIGYFQVGTATVYPFIASLGLLGLVLVLTRFVRDVNALVTGATDTDAEGLATVLAGFALSAASLPLFALIWGARRADITEVWTRFREGFVFGDTRISPTDFLVVLIVFVLGMMLTRLLQGALKASVLPKTKIDKGGQTAIVSGVGYVGIFLAAIIAVTSGGLDLSSLAIVAGALSVGIGFGLQNIVSNFVSGIILLIERPISEGDWIEVNGTHGIVKDISVRSTRLETFDKYDLIIPNADFVSGTVSNYTRGNSLGRIVVPVGVAYGTNTREVQRILLSIVREHADVMMNPPPEVDFIGFGADSLDFQIRAILYDVGKGLHVRTEIRHQIVERFAENGIEIPFAQRDVWLRNPESLLAAKPAEVSPEGNAADVKPPAEKPQAKDEVDRAAGSGLDLSSAEASGQAGDAGVAPGESSGDNR
jgi:small-conductance mechanosensitive channel